jgi:hypothetical protein
MNKKVVYRVEQKLWEIKIEKGITIDFSPNKKKYENKEDHRVNKLEQFSHIFSPFDVKNI